MTKPWRDINAVYQIYPRSFKDTDDNGIGDLPGIIQKLEYIADTLGAEAIWLSPFYPSPQADCGYDVSDFCSVDPLFGTMVDFDALVVGAHEKGLKVMIDLVPNHTSDQHAWFQESRSSRDNPKRDWYVWRDEPNNWISISGGSSWTLDETTGQYYLHSFMSSQPDLNWENPDVREAIKGTMRFWFDKGVDGFRVDAVWELSKDYTFADDPRNDGPEGEYSGYIHRACKDGPRLAEYLGELASVAKEYDDKYVLFEYYPDSQTGNVYEQLKLLHDVAPDVSAPFCFEGLHQPWHATHFGEALRDYLLTVPENARPSFCFSNHDQTRPVTRFGEDQARLIALLQMTLPGMPVMYYGDEIGMESGMIPEQLTKDKFEKTGDMGGRDPERTPMQWDDTVLGGFTGGTPWLPMNENTLKKNVMTELRDQDSWLNFYRQLLALRKESAVMRHGDFELVESDSGYVLAYKRVLDNTAYYVVCNFAAAMQVVSLPVPMQKVHVMTHLGSATILEDGRVSLQGYAAAILSEVVD